MRFSFKSACLAVALLAAGAPAPGQAPPAALGGVTGRVVLVDFWASWCTPCRRSFPWMNAMQRKYGGEGLQIIGVNVDKERALADEFLAETPAEFELRFDPAGKLAEAFGVQAMPSSFLLDASGAVIATHFGFKTADAQRYEREIVEALAGAEEK
ncbi:MAG TPA: TlpA disulfide reductase family protein [Gammaproteobacteria bacterium]